jgi:hypothetical protein
MLVPPWLLTAIFVAQGFALGLCNLGDANCTDAENEELRRVTVFALAAFVATIPGPIVLAWLRHSAVWLLVLVANGLLVLSLISR